MIQGLHILFQILKFMNSELRKIDILNQFLNLLKT